MKKDFVPRLDGNEKIKDTLNSLARIKTNEAWTDKERGHIVICGDCTDPTIYDSFFTEKVDLAIQDPPYNIAITVNSEQLFETDIENYKNFSRLWINNMLQIMKEDSSIYIWLGADQKKGFQPFADFILLMREFPDVKSRSFITLRNQRGYGTQKNWMSLRQELLYYTIGNPGFNVQYTDIPKILKGYYKKIGDENLTNEQRSKSECIRAGNVWVDIQQVFYRLKENVPGAYAQKPIKSISRIIDASSNEKDLVTDFFSHSGTTLLASEISNRRAIVIEKDPIFAELTIRRLENYRKTSDLGWQSQSPFPEIDFSKI
ncbi:MAG: site-specific DNA-methyltransferase [Spirochaetales bacterium]|nr:site-specific DNA-methyltransferase [Spirochaetales bacterium]